MRAGDTVFEEVGNAILALHYEQHDSVADETWGRPGRCAECRRPWPCATFLIVMGSM